MISVDAVSKAFGPRVVLDRLNLQVPAGAVTLLVGANGAGKTTLLRIMAGLLAPDAGTVRLHGHDLHRDRERALAFLSFLPQAPRFHPRLTTRQVLRYYTRLRGADTQIVEQELARWELGPHADVVTGHLSGGLRQRLGLAIFAAAPAPVRVLDEPGLSLDPQWRRHLQHYLLEQARAGACVLVATHLLGEWEGQVDQGLVLENGTIRRQLSPDRLRAGFFGRLDSDNFKSAG